ncbi:MAG: tetratricopeptide repeat protein [Candidatus Njordarchaeia archaeon]
MDILNTAYKLYFDGELGRAKEIVEKLKKKRKNDYRLWLLDALIKNKEKRYEDSLESVNKSLDIKSDNHEAWILKGHILVKLNDFEEALYAFNTAIEIQMEMDNYIDYESMIEKLKILIKLGKTKKARDLLKKLKEIIPEDEELQVIEKKLG